MATGSEGDVFEVMLHQRSWFLAGKLLSLPLLIAAAFFFWKLAETVLRPSWRLAIMGVASLFGLSLIISCAKTIWILVALGQGFPSIIEKAGNFILPVLAHFTRATSVLFQLSILLLLFSITTTYRTGRGVVLVVGAVVVVFRAASITVFDQFADLSLAVQLTSLALEYCASGIFVAVLFFTAARSPKFPLGETLDA